ncbi:MAG: hydroxypyruvate isomerase, partial [Blastocatellia bacterium]|nr:hydroxypyruvate isomerase [Blastocatellia bacterium]
MTPQNSIQAQTLSRRAMLLKTAGGLGTASLLTLSNSSYANPLWQSASGAKLNGRLKQSACRWCYQKIPLEDLAKFASEIGLKGIDLLNDPSDWPVVKKYGLIPTMVSGAGTIPDACNRKDLHDKLEKEFETNIPRAAENGVPNVITFSGNRKGMSDGEGLENT